VFPKCRILKNLLEKHRKARQNLVVIVSTGLPPLNNFPVALRTVIEKVATKVNALETAVELATASQTRTAELAGQISEKISLREHLAVLVDTKKCSNLISAAVRWFTSNIPLIGRILAGGDFRKTTKVYEETLKAAIGEPSSVEQGEDVQAAAVSISENDESILSGAGKI
jgi:hypothetical protein